MSASLAARTPLRTAGPAVGRRAATPTPLVRAVAPPTTVTIKRDDDGSSFDGGPAEPLLSLAPAVLPGTPHPSNAPFSEAKLIQMAKDLFATDTGVRGGPAAEALLADAFNFAFPVVNLGKAEYLKAVRSFSLREAIPNLNAHAYGFTVDKYETNRVWFFIRTTGTQTGPLNFFGKVIQPSSPPKQVLGAPEICSYTFDAAGKCTAFTGGYVADRRVGNTGGLGAVFGILHALGAPVPKPGSLGFAIASAVNKLAKAFKGLLAVFTGGGGKAATA